VGAHADSGRARANASLNNTGQDFCQRPGERFRTYRERHHIVYVDPDHDIVAVCAGERRAIDEFVKRLIAALGPAGK